MKYKCTDCGQEYDIKPDFCECGNNLFEEIADKQVVNENKKNENKTSFTIVEKTPQRPNYQRKIDIPSLSIFVLCIILSILSIIFIGENTDSKDKISNNNPVQNNSKELPSIETLWHENKRTVTPEPVAIRTDSKQISKNIQTQQKPAQTPQSIKTPKKTKINVQNKKNEASPTNKTVKINTPPKQEQKTVAQKPKAPDAEELRKEFEAYKISLRNKIGRSINFASVIGDGNCAVTFKIDQTGNLVNRKFTILSKNESLNDAVYSAFLNNATFKEPPTGYKGESLTLTVQMYGGTYEVILK